MPKDHFFNKLQEAGLKLKPSKSDFLGSDLHTWNIDFQEGALRPMIVRLKQNMNGLLPKQSLRLEVF